MNMSNSMQTSANEKAIGGLVQWVGLGIITLVALFGDVMFISLMWNEFPQGLLKVCAVMGAIATGISIIALVVGKSHWFRPGPQLLAAWMFTGAEVLVSVLNVIVSGMVALGQPLGYLDYWRQISITTPFLAMIGWIILGFLDQSRAMRHAHMEMQDSMFRANLEYEKAAFDAAMRLKKTGLEIQAEYLQSELESPERLAQIRQGAANLTSDILTDLTGVHVPRRVVPTYQPRVVSGSFAQQATIAAPAPVAPPAQAPTPVAPPTLVAPPAQAPTPEKVPAKRGRKPKNA